jgi:hypothetical protein
MTEPSAPDGERPDRGDIGRDYGIEGDVDIESLIEKMDPDPKVRRAIRAHLFKQLYVELGWVRLDDGTLVREGHDAEGEGDH